MPAPCWLRAQLDGTPEQRQAQILTDALASEFHEVGHRDAILLSRCANALDRAATAPMVDSFQATAWRDAAQALTRASLDRLAGIPGTRPAMLVQDEGALA